MLYALLVGRRGQARDVLSSWTWNLRRLGEIRAARSQVKGFRGIPDRELNDAMMSGSARISQFVRGQRSEEHTSELQSLMRISYAVFCLKKKKKTRNEQHHKQPTKQ